MSTYFYFCTTVLLFPLKKSVCAMLSTTDFAYLLDANLLNDQNKVKTRTLDILPELEHSTQRWIDLKGSEEDFFEVREETEVTTVLPLRIHKIIESFVKKEAEYKLASLINEIHRNQTSSTTTTTTTTTKATTTKAKPKTTKGRKTKWKWSKPNRPLQVKRRTTKRTTRKVATTKKKNPSANPFKRSCGRMSRMQEEMLNENDVSDMIFFSPKKTAKPKAKPKAKPAPKHNRGKKNPPKKQQHKTTKKGNPNNRKKATTKVQKKTTTTDQTPPDWINSYNQARRSGNIIVPKKPVFMNDTHVLMVRQIPAEKLDNSLMVYPFVVTLHADPPMAGRICVGSLIASSWVLTAARCVTLPYVKVTRFRFGDLTLPPNEAQFSAVTKSIVHPSYEETSSTSDIALLRVKKVSIEEKVGKLTSVDYTTMIGQPIRYAGFGFTTPADKMFSEDQRKPMQIVDAEVVACDSNNTLKGPFLCLSMKHWKKHQMTLTGDAGSPAMHFGRVAGVCTGEAKPPIGFYTPISPFLDWVRYSVLLNEM